MYNAHRPIGPAQSSRLNELLESIRVEFDNSTRNNGDFDITFNNQVAEFDLIRSKLQALENNFSHIRTKYDEDVNRLRRELDARTGSNSHLNTNHQMAHQQPPNIGNGQGSFFANIMSNQGGNGLAPLPTEQQQPQQQGLQPGNQNNIAPMPMQNPIQHSQFNNHGALSTNGYGNGVAPSTNSPGSRQRGPRGPVGAMTPHQNPQIPYTDIRASPQARSPPTARTDVGNQLADLNPESLGPSHKKEGDDWYAVFNPRVPRQLDVDLVHTLTHESVVCCVRFCQDGRYVATGCKCVAQIFDVATGRLVTSLSDDSVDKDEDFHIRSVCFSPDAKYLATGAEDKQIRVWDIERKEIKMMFSGHEQDIYSLDFSPDGRHIASGSGDRTVRVWNLEAGREVLCLQIEDGVTTVAMSPDGRYVAAGSLDKSVRVWDVRSGHLHERLDGPEGHRDSVYSVAFAPTGGELVSGSLDKSIKMWELGEHRPPMGHSTRGGKCTRTFEGHKDFVLSVALTPDGAWVLSGSKDRGVQFWDPRTGDAQLMLQGHKNSVISVAPSPAGGMFATASGDKNARIWKYSAWKP